MGKRIISVGDLVLDLIMGVSLPVLPAQHQEPAFRRMEPGGAANFMIAAQHMGLEVSAAGAVGTDIFGTQILDFLKMDGIDTTHVTTPPGSTSTLVLVLTDQTSGEHVFLGHYGDGPEVPYPPRLDQAVAAADLVFVLGYTLTEARVLPLAQRAIERSAAVGVPVYMDVGPFMRMVAPEIIRQVIGPMSLLLMTEEEVPSVSEGRSGFEAYRYLLDSGPSALIVKQGASGCLVITREGQEQIPGYPVKVVDTVGAGDCFAGAFVAGRLNGLSLSDAARLANAMGAATVQKIGAGRNAPTCEEVLAVLEQAGERLNFPC
jgi:ribokinase